MSDVDYRKLLDAFGDAVVIGDRSGSIVYANPAVGKLLGWTREELLGRPLTLLIPHRLRSRHTAGFNRARSTRQHRVLGKALRLPVLQASGTELSAEMVLSAFRGGAGEELFIATFRERGLGGGDEIPTSARHLSGICRIAGQLGGGDDLAAFARRLELLASAHLGACGVRLWIAESPNRLRLLNRRPDPDLREPEDGVLTPSASGTLPAVAAHTRRLVRATRERHGEEAERLDRHGIVVSAAIPLLDGDELLGVLHFLSGDSWSEELAQALSLLGGLAGAVLRENQRRELELRQRAMGGLGQALSELSAQLAALPAGASIDPLLESILEHGLRLTGADEGSVVLLDPSSGESGVRVCAGYKSPITGMFVPEGAGLTAQVMESGRAVSVPDYQQFEGALPRIRQRGVRAAFGVPLIGPDHLFGVLALGTKRRDKRFTETDLVIAQALANLAALAVASRQD